MKKWTHLGLLLLRRRLEMRVKNGFHHLHGSDLTFLKRLPLYQDAEFICLNAALHQFMFILRSKRVKMSSSLKNSSLRN